MYVNLYKDCKGNRFYVHRLVAETFIPNSENCRASLTADQVREIRLIYIKGNLEFGAAALAEEFSVARSTIQRIVDGERYKNVD